MEWIFEGLKTYRTKDGNIQLFCPDQNAERLQRTADRLPMSQVLIAMFINTCKQVVLPMEQEELSTFVSSR